MRILLAILGFTLIFLGFIIISIGFIPELKIQGGGLILIGPFPFFFYSGQLSPIFLIIIFLIPLIIFFILLIFFFKLIRARVE